jgi:hypothetical protein
MLEKLELLIEALREELKQYGEMLALLDQQQEFVLAQKAAEILEVVAAISRQAELLKQARAQREFSRLQLARMLDQPDGTRFDRLTAEIPADYRPLVNALVEENNQLLYRIQQRARQNHLLLSRCLELSQKLMATLFSAGGVPVYDQQGQALAPSLPQRALYEALG